MQNKIISDDAIFIFSREKVVIIEDKESGNVNIAIPTDIAKCGLIESTKDPAMKKELGKLFWDYMEEWGREKGYIK